MPEGQSASVDVEFQLPEPAVPFEHDYGRVPPTSFALHADEPTALLPSPLEADGSLVSGSSPSDGLPKRKLRIAIVSENLMPKVDGVTRCLARLLAHLREQGHEAVVLGPQSGMTHYETHPLVGTAGIPLVVYPGLKLNFLRPRFLHVIGEFNPDVIHIVEPIWLGAQVLLAMQLGWAGKDWKPVPVQDRKPGVPRGPGGAVVASYHTNLPTYATLFGFPWLEPIMWRLVCWLHGKCLLTACPSESTADMLRSRGISNVRIWPRGVDLELFGPHRRSHMRRQSWGVQYVHRTANDQILIEEDNETEENNKKASELELANGFIAPLTPPPSPDLLPADEVQRRNESVVVLYVGRVSYEKNLMLLVEAFEQVLRNFASNPSSSPPHPRIVFVGDGPARAHIDSVCREKGIDAIFEGHLSGTELAEAYASADIFAFPSFTETFGQVVLEALASGLPVVGLDAEGTRDLVVEGRTGLLLHKSDIHTHTSTVGGRCNCEWSTLLSESSTSPSSMFQVASKVYADLLSKMILTPQSSSTMRKRARSEGTVGRTWYDAMEAMVDCYREGIEIAEGRSGMRRSPARRRTLDGQWWCSWTWTMRPLESIGIILAAGGIVAAAAWFLLAL